MYLQAIFDLDVKPTLHVGCTVGWTKGHGVTPTCSSVGVLYSLQERRRSPDRSSGQIRANDNGQWPGRPSGKATKSGKPPGQNV